jgi:acyl-coenzyme A thioesterase PaaI-like protein
MNLIDDQMCFICGTLNDSGLKLKFEKNGINQVTTTFTPEKKYQGYKDIVHGGIISAVLDEVMVNAAWMNGMPSVSAQIEIRFHHPAKVGETLNFKGLVHPKKGRLIMAEGEATDLNGRKVASGTAKLMKIDHNSGDN